MWHHIKLHKKDFNMKRKFRKVLSEKCKDFGLTEKALDELSEIGVDGLKDDASDEDIANKADSLIPFAKAMQAEITRKTQKKQSAEKQSADNKDDKSGAGEGNKGEGNENEVPSWFKVHAERLQTLEDENKKLKAEKAASERAATIAEKAKKLGIPEFLLEGRTFAEDADLDKELANFKQKLVNHNLVGKGASHEQVTSKEQMTTEEDSWAKALPDKKL